MVLPREFGLFLFIVAPGPGVAGSDGDIGLGGWAGFFSGGGFRLVVLVWVVGIDGLYQFGDRRIPFFWRRFFRLVLDRLCRWFDRRMGVFRYVKRGF